jgi:Rrf2 family iron-sulfur cluster assembly transcriptional regulator
MAPRPLAGDPAETGAGQPPPDAPKPQRSLGATILGRQDLHALKALMVLAEEPQRWHSVADLATRQNLPAALLEQLLLRLRRAGLLQARRGRAGGYRLAAAAQTISLAAVLGALRPTAMAAPLNANPARDSSNPELMATERVASLLEKRLWRSLNQELSNCTLADLLHDLHSARAGLEEGGAWLLG